MERNDINLRPVGSVRDLVAKTFKSTHILSHPVGFCLHARAYHCHRILILPCKNLLYLGILESWENCAFNSWIISKTNIAFISFVRICLLLFYAFNIGVHNFSTRHYCLCWSFELTVENAPVFIHKVKVIIYPNLIPRFVFLFKTLNRKEALAGRLIF